jgi:hypothetical protein
MRRQPFTLKTKRPAGADARLNLIEAEQKARRKR